MLPAVFQIGLGFGGFQQILQNMQSLGFFQFLFPFLLALAVFYGIFRTALKERLPSSAISLISLIFAFFVMLFASSNPGIVLFLQNVSGGFLIAGTGILFLVIILGIVGFKFEELLGKESEGKTALALLVAIVGIVVFLGAGGSLLIPSIAIGSELWTIFFFVVILAVVLYFLGKEKKEGKT